LRRRRPGRAAAVGAHRRSSRPEVGADSRVTFRLRAPNAKEVAATLAGNRLAMQKDEQGVWSVTTDVLAPDYYTYSLVVDGTSIALNRQFKDWLRVKNVQFTELETPDVGHVWPYWRQNFTEFATKAFQK
jgi:1,4-alpha-glucan branching enzyme